nr:pentatricopeptide repeat-containing protein At2g15690 [Tanacetum cinerariifolium]
MVAYCQMVMVGGVIVSKAHRVVIRVIVAILQMARVRDGHEGGYGFSVRANGAVVSWFQLPNTIACTIELGMRIDCLRHIICVKKGKLKEAIELLDHGEVADAKHFGLLFGLCRKLKKLEESKKARDYFLRSGFRVDVGLVHKGVPQIFNDAEHVEMGSLEKQLSDEDNICYLEYIKTSKN